MNKLERLQKSLARFNPEMNYFWKLLLTSWATELDDAVVQIDEAKNQLYITLASGNYLDDAAKNLGVYRPNSIINTQGDKELIPALSDIAYRQFVPLLSYYPKQIKDTMVKILDIFWGPTYSRVTVTSINPELYDMSSTKVLNIIVDKINNISIIFRTSDFLNPYQATVDEIVTVINRSTDKIVALKYRDIVTSLNYVQFYTNTIGLSGSIEVIDVLNLTAYNISRAPEINSINGAPFFISFISSGTALGKFEVASLGAMLVGSIITIDTTIPSIGGQSCFVKNIEGTGPYTITVIAADDANATLNFSNEIAETVKVAIHEVNNKEIVINIPEAIPIILDSLKGSHHFHPTTSALFTTSVDLIGANSYFNGYSLNDYSVRSSMGGPHGAGINSFSYPSGIYSDEDFIYIVDGDNGRVEKRDVNSQVYVTEGNSFGGVTPLMPIGLTGDVTYLYFTDTARHEVVQVDKSMSFVARHGTLGTGNNNLHSPTGIVQSNGFLFVCDTENHRIVKLDVGGLAYVDQVGSFGAGNNNFNCPAAITADDTYIYISDYNNNRVVKRRQSTLAYIAQAPINDCSAIFYDAETDKLILSDWISGVNDYIRIWHTTLAEQTFATLYNLGDISMCGLSTAISADTVVIDPNWPGSFLYDPDETVENFELTGKKCKLGQIVQKGESYITVIVDDTSLLDDSGYLVFNFGKSTQEKFIPYVEITNLTQVKLNPTYRFLYNHAIGEDLNVITRGALVPRTSGEDFAAYMINPNIAEFLVSQLITLVKAAGVLLRFEIQRTHYLHEDLENL